MRGPILALCFLALSLAWLVLFGAGVQAADWSAAMLFLGGTALFYWTFRTGQTAPKLSMWHTCALWALPLYAAFQLLPLPPALLESLSPSRALIADSLGGVIPNLSREPISVVPATALLGLFSLLTYLAAFSLIRDIEWRSTELHPWMPSAPLAAIASLESVVGLGQWLSGPPSTTVSGTFSSSEPFAGLLEIALPFTLVFGFISFRRHQNQETASARASMWTAVSWGSSLLLLLTSFRSSRASRTVVPASLFILLALALIPRLKTKKLRWYGAGGAVAVALIALLFIVPPSDFTPSLARLGAPGLTESNLVVWNSSASLIADFRWFGTGPGGFEPTFLKYQAAVGLNRVQDPGNDILALLITFGIVGSALALAALAGILRPAITGALFLTDEPRRLLATAAVASFSAVLLRSSLETNLSVPAIGLAFAWLAGVSQSCGLE